MKYDVLVLGLGNIGLSISRMLLDSGYKVAGIDLSEERLEVLKGFGGDAFKVNLLSKEDVYPLVRSSRVLASALPGSIAYRVLTLLASIKGIKLVDVSFFPESGSDLEKKVSDNGSIFFLDCGVAPGLSNMLLRYGVEKAGGRRGYIYVGGISEEPIDPLGYVATWNISDFIEEYIRPARVIQKGEVVELDPLSHPVGRRFYENVGELEYFPSDGLRSMLKNFSFMEELVEYTLRWPGHIEKMRFLKQLGFLEDDELEICKDVSPRRILELQLLKSLPREGDMVVLEVEVHGDFNIRFTTVVKPWKGYSAMALSTAGFQYSVVKSLVDEILDINPGIHYPEDIPIVYFDWFKEVLKGMKINIKEEW